MYRVHAVALLLLVGSFCVSASGVVERTTWHGIREIDINGSFLDFRIEGTGPGPVEVIPGELKSNVEFKVFQQGTRLFIEVDRRFSLVTTGRNEVVRVRVPRSTEVNASTASGSLTVSDLESDRVDLGTVSGALNAGNLTGRIEVSTVSGALALTEASGTIVATTTSGSITLEDIEGPIDVKSTSGAVRIREAAGVLNSRSVSGSQRVSGFRAEGDCSFRSTSGSIGVEFTNRQSDFSFDLASTSGALEAFDSGGNRRLTVGSGRFTIVGSTVSGSQRYR